MAKIIRINDVLARTGLRRSTLYLRLAQGFPRPVKLGGGRAMGFIEAEIDAWIAAQVAARDGDSMLPVVPQAGPDRPSDKPDTSDRTDRRKPRLALDAVWEPDDALEREVCREHGWPLNRLAVEVERFRRHHVGAGDLRGDWRMTFRNHCRDVAKRDAKRPIYAAPTGLRPVSSGMSGDDLDERGEGQR